MLLMAARPGIAATLRALGYEAVPVAVSIVLEAVILSLIGALVGVRIAWLLSRWAPDSDDGKRARAIRFGGTDGTRSRMGPGARAVGQLVSALRAARLPVAHALGAT